MTDLLFLSNGYGEDAIAAKIASLVSKNYSVAAFPLVGEGKGLEKRGIRIAGSYAPLAGAGVSLSRDLRGGLFPLLAAQGKALKKLAPEVRRVVAVGDIFPVFLSSFVLKKDFYFVGTAKSVYVQPYNAFERFLLKKSLKIFVRDQDTANHLRRKRIDAEYAGNPMMDEVGESEIRFPEFSGLSVALFPGSREDSPRNFLMQVEALNYLQSRLGGKVRGIALLPPTLGSEKFVQKLDGWDGISYNAKDGIICRLELKDVSLFLVSGCLGSVIENSAIVFGQAGTANEQAAGAGKPIIAFDLQSSRPWNTAWRYEGMSWYRWRQKKLLGAALAVVRASPEALAEKADEILGNRNLYGKMSEEGKKRIGNPGASEKIARALEY